MKKIKFYVVITMLAFATVSCVENSSKYKAAIAQRDSLALQKQNLDSTYSQTLNLLNDIEAGFADINQNESQLKVDLKGVEGNANRKERIGVQMMEIKKSMEDNKTKIAELQHLVAKNGKANRLLTETINDYKANWMQKVLRFNLCKLNLNKKILKSMS